MKAFAALALFAVSSFSIASATTPPAALLAVVRGVVAAVNANNAPKVGSYFEADSFVVDEFPPYVWKGSNAGGRWWVGVANYDVAHNTTLRARAGAINVANVSVNDAYVVVPLTIDTEKKGIRHSETGLWALTLHRTGVTWRISTATWATQTP